MQSELEFCITRVQEALWFCITSETSDISLHKTCYYQLLLCMYGVEQSLTLMLLILKYNQILLDS
jgi:hypothetical protein